MTIESTTPSSGLTDLQIEYVLGRFRGKYGRALATQQIVDDCQRWIEHAQCKPPVFWELTEFLAASLNPELGRKQLNAEDWKHALDMAAELTMNFAVRAKSEFVPPEDGYRAPSEIPDEEPMPLPKPYIAFDALNRVAQVLAKYDHDRSRPGLWTDINRVVEPAIEELNAGPVPTLDGQVN